MIKKCSICGGDFSAPPSAKRSTCSQECRSERARRNAAIPRNWSNAAKQKLATKGQTENLKTGTFAARAIALSEPENFHEAKVWQVINPAGKKLTITNLRRTLINQLGDDEGSRLEALLRRMSSAMQSGKAAWWTRCGWTLCETPKLPTSLNKQKATGDSAPVALNKTRMFQSTLP